MRHLRSILYALVLAPAVWILCGVGFTQDLTGRARDAGSVETASAILLLVLAGAAYAILVFSPISPLGPALFGLIFLGVSMWAVIAPDSYAGVWPAGITKEGFDLSRPGYALAALLAIPMLCTALSVRRWRGYEPPQLPLIGTLGRARGAAVAPGMPVAAERTAVITTADPTEVMTLPTPAPPPPGQVAPSPVAGTPWPALHQAEPPTEAMPTQPVPVGGADEPTAVVAPAPADEPTTTEMNGDEPTVLAAPAAGASADVPGTEQPGDEPTATVPPATSSPAEPSPAEPSPADESTVLVVSAPDEEPTAPHKVAVPDVTPVDEAADPPSAAETDEPAEAVPPSEEPTQTTTASEEPVGVDPDVLEDEVAAEKAAAGGTDVTAGPLPAETVATVAGAEPVADAEPVGAGAEPMAAPADNPTEAHTHEVDTAAAADVEPTDAGTAEVQAGTAVDDESTEAHTREALAAHDQPTEAHTREVETITAEVGAEQAEAPTDEEERTQVIRLPLTNEPTQPLGHGDRTRDAGPGETTQVIFWREPINQPTPEEAARAQAAADQSARDRAAQERARQAFRDRAAQERAKAAFAERAARDARERGEDTQVINLAALGGPPIPGDRTQVLPGAGRTPHDVRAEPAGDRTQRLPDARMVDVDGDRTQMLPGAGERPGDRTQTLPGAGTVEPPGDRTQVLSFPPTARPAAPARQNPGEATTDKQEPATRANSIIGAEQPDPGADPTTRLSSVRPAGTGTGTGTGEDTTADVGDPRRTKGVLDLERPADETADDTRRLVLPPPLRPSDDEPTTRL